MVKKRLLMLLFCIGAMYAGLVEYGTAYIKNNSPYTLEVRATVIVPEGLDAHDVSVMRSWTLEPGDTEVLGNMRNINRLHFHAVFDDPATAPAKLKGKKPIQFVKRSDGDDLLLNVGINHITGAWLVEPEYSQALKVQAGGPSGYHVRVEQP